MRGAIGSLNAAVAGSILLFEAVAQRDPEGRATTSDPAEPAATLEEPTDGAQLDVSPAESGEVPEVAEPAQPSEAAATTTEPDEIAQPDDSPEAEHGLVTPAIDDLLPDGPEPDQPEAESADRV